MDKFEDYESYDERSFEDKEKERLELERLEEEREYKRQVRLKFQKRLLMIYIPVFLVIVGSYFVGSSLGYNIGQDQMRIDVYDDIYNEIMVLAYDDGVDEGYNDGYNTGYQDGRDEGSERGYNEAYNIGYDKGETAGFNDGYDDGFNDGHDMGYPIGVSNGYDDGVNQYTEEMDDIAFNEARDAFVLQYLQENEQDLIDTLISSGFTCNEFNCRREINYFSDDETQWDYYELGTFVIERKSLYITDENSYNHQVIRVNLHTGMVTADWDERINPLDGVNRSYNFYTREYLCFDDVCTQEQKDWLFDWYEEAVTIIELADLDWLLYLEKK